MTEQAVNTHRLRHRSDTAALNSVRVRPGYEYVRTTAVRYYAAAFHDPSPENLRRCQEWLGRLEACRG